MQIDIAQSEKIWEQLIPKWKSAVDELRSSVEEEIYKLEIHEAEVADCKKFWEEMITILAEAKESLHQNGGILEIAATLESVKADDINSLPDDRWEKLKNVKRALQEYMSEEKIYESLAERSGSVPPEERRDILTELGMCIEAQEKCKLTVQDGMEVFVSIATELSSKPKSNPMDPTSRKSGENGDIAESGDSSQEIISDQNHVQESKKEFEVDQECQQAKEAELSSEIRMLQVNCETLREENSSLSLEVSHLRRT